MPTEIQTSHTGVLIPLHAHEVQHAASFGLETSDLTNQLDLSEPPVPLLDAVDEHLKDFEDELPTVTEDEQEASYTSDPEEHYKNHAHWDQPRELSDERVAVLTRSAHQRSSSAPAKPLKSALVKSPPGSPPPEHEADLTYRKKKKARFEEKDRSTSDLSLRRRITNPAGLDSAATAGTESSHAQADRSYTVSLSWPGDYDALSLEAEDAAAEMVEDSTKDEEAEETTPSETNDAEYQDAATELRDRSDSEVNDEDSATTIDQEHLRVRWDRAPTNENGLRHHVHSNDDGPIDLPTDQQDDEVAAEMMLLPVINEPTQQDPTPLKTPNQRRLSDPQGRGRSAGDSESGRRRSSMTDFTKLKGRLKLRPIASKASPADCAITLCSVRAAEPPKLNTVYEQPAARYKHGHHDKRPTTNAQTVCSGSSTYQMVWEEPSRSSSASEITLYEAPEAPEVDEQDDQLLSYVSRSPSPMGKADTKLAAWSWAREMAQDDDDEPRSIPLETIDDGITSQIVDPDHPLTPPNTERGSGPSSARHSDPQTPYQADGFDDPEAQEDTADNMTTADEIATSYDDGEEPVRLRFKTRPSRVCSEPTNTDYFTSTGQSSRSLPSSPLPRQLSNLNAEDAHFKSHQDSFYLVQQRREREDKMNQHLMTARDSFLLTRMRYDGKYGKAGATSQWNRYGGLSTIPDASPPDASKSLGWKARSKLAEESMKVEVAKPEEHAGCAICAAERPRWFEVHCKKGLQEVGGGDFMAWNR